MKLKQYSILFCSFLFAGIVNAQDINAVLKDADNLEKQLKESAALDKYKQAALMDPNNIAAVIKCAELNASIGGRLADKNSKNYAYLACRDYAQKAYLLDSNNASANYVMSLAASKMQEVETDKKKITEFTRQTKWYADKALALNPNLAKANYAEGKWHMDMLNVSWLKKTQIKTFYGGVQSANIDSAIYYLDKGKTLDMYSVPTYMELAKAYQVKNQPAKAIEVLNKLVKLPTRTEDDAALKAEGQKMLSAVQ